MCGQQYHIEEKHGVRKKVRWEFYKGQNDPWWVQCVSTAQRQKKIWGHDVHAGIGMKLYITWLWQCSLVWSCAEQRGLSCDEERGLSCVEEGIRFLGWTSKKEREAKEDMVKAGWGRKYEGWLEKKRRTLPFKVVCWHKKRLQLRWGESGHPHLLGILADFQHWCISLSQSPRHTTV